MRSGAPPRPRAASQSKQANDAFLTCLFYDYLFFDPAVDNIMNIGARSRTGCVLPSGAPSLTVCHTVHAPAAIRAEPAILMMQNSLPKYKGITTTLLEYLLYARAQFDPSRAAAIANHIDRALQQLVSKRVVASLGAIFLSEHLDPALAERAREAFSNVLGPPAAAPEAPAPPTSAAATPPPPPAAPAPRPRAEDEVQVTPPAPAARPTAAPAPAGPAAVAVTAATTETPSPPPSAVPAKAVKTSKKAGRAGCPPVCLVIRRVVFTHAARVAPVLPTSVVSPIAPLRDLSELRPATAAILGTLLAAAQREAEHAADSSAGAPVPGPVDVPAAPALEALLDRFLVRPLKTETGWHGAAGC